VSGKRRVLTEDDVLSLVALYAEDENFAKLARSHETLRHELERLGTFIDVAVKALSSARRPLP